MAVARLAPNKKLRRLVTVKLRNAPVEFDVTVASRGLTVRLPGTVNRKRLFLPWDVAFQNMKDEQGGYRVWSMEEAIAHLCDTDPTPEDCPCCHTKNAWKKAKIARAKAKRRLEAAANAAAEE